MQVTEGTEGNDTIAGPENSVDDSIFGGAGDDSITGGLASLRSSIFGEAGNDTIFATEGGTDDTLDGGAGADELIARLQKNAVLRGGDGDDILQAISSVGTFFHGGAGDDRISMANISGVDSGDATLNGGAGDDELFGFYSSDLLIWDAGNDSIYGGVGSTLRIDIPDVTINYIIPKFRVVAFTDGTQTARVQDIDTFMFNGETVAFEDLVAPIAFGTAGDDLLVSSEVGSNIDALAGDDWITLGFESGAIEGGTGLDMLSFANFTHENTRRLGFSGTERPAILGTLNANDEGHFVSFSGIEGITGTIYADRFEATDGLSTLRGLGGRDYFDISLSSNPIHVDGGNSRDTVSYIGVDEDISVSLLRGKGWVGVANGDSFEDVENLSGGAGNDTLTGDHGDNVISGGLRNGTSSSDVLIGNGGDDYLIGGGGQDRAIYSYGRDLYEIETTDGYRTTVTYIGEGPGNGTDTLEYIDILQFADGDYYI